MIRSFRHAGLEAFFRTGSKAGIQPKHAKKLRLQLGALNRASGPNDMAVPSWRLHPLHGDQQGRWAVWVDENWRLTFAPPTWYGMQADYDMWQAKRHFRARVRPITNQTDRASA